MLRAHSNRPSILLMPVTSPRAPGYIHFRVGCKFKDSCDPRFKSDNLLGWLKTHKIFGLQLTVYNEGYNSRIARWKRHREQGMGASQSATFPHAAVFPNPEAPASFQSCNQSSLRSHEWMTHWPVGTELHLQFLSPRQGWGGTKNSSSVIMWLVFLVSSPPPPVSSLAD